MLLLLTMRLASLRMSATRLKATLVGGGDAREWLSGRVATVLAEEEWEGESMVTFATKPEFGDFQCNAALPLAKKLGEKPRVLAERLVERLASPYFTLEVAGPGFVNAKMTEDYLASTVSALAREYVAKTERPQRVVVDYSSPNIAKEMHVGHLRSTVIGDCLANLLEIRGHSVTRQNHVGDWGTQFGMLIAHLDGRGYDSLSDLVKFYKESKKRFDEDEEFKNEARRRVVMLQSGDEETIETWRSICEASRREFDAVYERLGVSIEEKGESAYNDRLSKIVEHLQEIDLAQESEGALVVGNLIVKKSDGGYNYATTDLAAASYRYEELGAERILYVTDSGQASHFKQVFQVAHDANLVPPTVSLEHVPFGVVQGEDGKKFKTRSGDTVKLKDLLDEAEERAAAVAGNEDIDYKAIGIGAVKYADLSLNRESNYKFSFDKMLALSGNTAPYMLYSYARINGIIQKAGGGEFISDEVVFTEEEEKTLARVLARFSPVLAELERDLRPNVLCDFLFDTSQAFNRFYEQCPVNQAPTPEIKNTRITLCLATRHILRQGLEILGIRVIEKM